MNERVNLTLRLPKTTVLHPVIFTLDFEPNCQQAVHVAGPTDGIISS